MKYRLEIQKNKYGIYYYYRADIRENGKSKPKRVYIGEEKQALKVIADITSNNGKNERLLEFSGPVLLDYIAQKLKLSKLINNVITKETGYDPGKLLLITIITRVLHPESKFKLANYWFDRSYLTEQFNFHELKISEDLIYQYMDYLHPHLLTIQKEIVKNIFKYFSLQSDELLFDGTSFKSYGIDSKEGNEDESDQKTEDQGQSKEKIDDLEDGDDLSPEIKTIKRLKGYPRDKRKDLAQINYMLGINGEYIPFYFEVFSGNVADVDMFLTTLKRLQKDFPFLLTQFKKKFIIFDKGNWNETVLKNLKKIKDTYDCSFIAAIRGSFIEEIIQDIDFEHGIQLIKNDYGLTTGHLIDFTLYSKPVKCLVYKIPVIAKKDHDNLEKRITSADSIILELKQDTSLTPNEFYKAVKSELRKHKLTFFYTIEKPKLKQETRPEVIKKEDYTKIKFLMCGVFVIATNSPLLTAEKIYSLYHSKNVVEQSFHLYKDLFEARNVFHSRSDRIETHFFLVSWGFMLVSLLRSELAKLGLNFTFEQLLLFIKESYISQMNYVYPEFKSFTIQRVVNLNSQIEQVFKAFNLSYDLFSIDLMTTSDTSQ